MCGCEAQRASGPSVILRRQVVRLSISMSTQPRTKDTLNGQRPNANKDKEQPSRKNTHGAEAKRGNNEFFLFFTWRFGEEPPPVQLTSCSASHVASRQTYRPTRPLS